MKVVGSVVRRGVLGELVWGGGIKVVGRARGGVRWEEERGRAGLEGEGGWWKAETYPVLPSLNGASGAPFKL